MDKYITRMAQLGHERILMFNRWWDLRPDFTYSVKFNRQQPGKSTIGGTRA